MDDSPTDLLIEGTTAEQVHSDAVVQSSVNLRWLALGGLALALLLFGLTQWPKGESTSPETGAAVANASDDSPGDDDELEDAAADEDDTGAAEGDRSVDGSAEGNETTTTERGQETNTSASTGGALTEDGASAEAGGPLVGEETGLGVIYGSQGFGRLKLLELDTGIIHELEATGDPLGVIGSSLVTRRSSSVAFYSLRSVDAEAVRITSQDGWVDVVALSDDRVWVIDGDPGPDGWTIVGYDESGAAAEESAATVAFPFFGWNPSDEFVQGDGGGIYRRVGEGYQRVSIGTLVAAGENMVLARECDERFSCQLHWYDRDDWSQPLDIPTPDLPLQGTVTISNNDRWLIASNWTNGSTKLHEVETGRVVREIRLFNGPFVNSISPDGRWLLDSGLGKTVIVDLDSGTEWPQEALGELGVFVDLAVVDFAG